MDRRVKRTRKLIKDAFTELLKEKPLSSITITELTKRADIDRRTFYLHFSCIEDIIDDIESEATSALHEILSVNTTFDIGTFFTGLTKMMEDNMDYYKIITKEPAYYRFLLHCKNLLKESLKETFVSKTTLSDDEFNINLEYIASGIMGIYTDWIISDSKLTLSELTTKAEATVSKNFQLLL